MDNLDAARLVSDIRAVQDELRAAIAHFEARTDEEVAQLNLGWFGTVESPRTVAELAREWREWQRKVIEVRLAELDNWVAMIGEGIVTEPVIAVMDWFLTEWDREKRAMTRACYCGCPSIEPPHIERGRI